MPRRSDPATSLGLLRVLSDEGIADPSLDPGLSDSLLMRAYREMRRVRLLDSKMTTLQRQGRVGFYGSATGQEAVPVAAGLVLEKEDWVFPALREQAVMLVRGFPLVTFLSQIFGRDGDVLRGRQMPSHHSARAVGQVSWSSCIATQLPHAVGTAWAMRARRAKTITLAFLGDGATSQGDFHAAMNFAGVWRVPCVFVCQNNQYSISVPTSRQTASATLAMKAGAYGMPGVRVDGNDFLAMVSALRGAAERARNGGGPTFIEAVTYRVGPHSTSDDPSRYRAQSEVDLWVKRDPIGRLRMHLNERGLLTDAADGELARELSDEIAAAIAEVESWPPPPPESLFEDVYAAIPRHLKEQLETLLKSPRPGLQTGS